MGSASQLQPYRTTFGNKDPWQRWRFPSVRIRQINYMEDPKCWNYKCVNLFFNFHARTHTHTLIYIAQQQTFWQLNCLRWYIHKSGHLININKMPVRRQRNSYWPHYLENFLTTLRCQDGCRTNWNSWKLLFNKFASRVLDWSIQTRTKSCISQSGQVREWFRGDVGCSSGFC